MPLPFLIWWVQSSCSEHIDSEEMNAFVFIRVTDVGPSRPHQGQEWEERQS